eukprot:scaffold301346_cov28-Prasinocladus_malaysianus.AAC.1
MRDTKSSLEKEQRKGKGDLPILWHKKSVLFQIMMLNSGCYCIISRTCVTLPDRPDTKLKYKPEGVTESAFAQLRLCRNGTTSQWRLHSTVDRLAVSLDEELPLL